MQITQIRKITQKKYLITLEDGTSFPLYTGEIRRYKLSDGTDIDDKTLHILRDEVLVKRAEARCLKLLEAMDRTESELRARLRHDGYPDEIIETAVEYVRSFHYIDDRRYAETYVRQQAGIKSALQIRTKLLQKGIGTDIIEEAFSAGRPSYTESGSTADLSPDISAILRLAQKRHFDPDSADRETSEKFIQYLMRKGFRLPDIREALTREALTHFPD